ncbi:MAG: PQQ-binding-like beta-propeller repeat protein [Candidatus Aureabacteria bacterium]|nr:PQQ-binding-like beta-propeller repeat protein [Candidatus Auribacterota bacterium]
MIKKIFISLIIISGATLCVNNDCLAQPADSPWPMFGHDAQHTGRSDYAGPQTCILAWSYETGGRITSSPALDSSGMVLVGSHDGNIYGFEHAGSLIWSYQLLSLADYSSPAIGASSRIYVGGAALTAIGSLSWSYDMGVVGVQSSAVIAPDESTYIGTEDARLYRMNSTGRILWSYETGGALRSSPALSTDASWVCVGSMDARLYTIHSSGQLLWTFITDGPPLQRSIESSPAISSENNVYVGNEYGAFYAITSTGTLLWTFESEGWAPISSSPAIGSDGVYMGADDGRLYSIGPLGGLLWSYKNICSSPTVDSEGSVFISGNPISCFTSSGAMQWSYHIPGGSTSSPSIDDRGRVYIGGVDNKLYVFTGPSPTPTPMPTATPTPMGTEWKCPSATGLIYNDFKYPEKACSDDEKDYATAVGCAEQDYYNFNFSVPENCAISGIAVKVKASGVSMTELCWLEMKLSWNKGDTWTSKKIKHIGEFQEHVLGGNSDKWGRTWSPAEFSNSNFLLYIKFCEGLSYKLAMLQVRITYSIFTPTPTPIPTNTPTITPTSTSTYIPAPAISSYAYVTNAGSKEAPGNTISRIDLSSFTVDRTITVGLTPMGIAITPDGTWLYVVNNDSDSVSVIHTGDAREVMKIPVGAEPLGIAIDHAGRYAYVVNSMEDPETTNGTVSVIDIASQKVVGEITVGMFPGWGIAVSNDDSKLAVANINDNTIYLMDTATRSLINVISRVDGDKPMGVAFGPGDGWLYIAYFSDGTGDHVRAVDLSGGNADGYYDTDGEGPFGICFHPEGGWFVVSNYFGHNIFHCAVGTGGSGMVNVAAGPMWGAFTADGSKFLMPCFGSSQGAFAGTVDVFECSGGTPAWTRRVSVGINPAAVAIANRALSYHQEMKRASGIGLFVEPKLARSGDSVYLNYAIILPDGVKSIDAGVIVGGVVNNIRYYAFTSGFRGMVQINPNKASSIPKAVSRTRLTDGQNGFLRINGLLGGVSCKFFIALTDTGGGKIIYSTFSNSVMVE